MKKYLVWVSAVGFALTIPAIHGHDTDIYVGATNSNTSGRPKVLIILDNSGSMNTEVPTTPPAYDPSTTYATQGDIVSTRIYWSTDGKPPKDDTDDYFLANSNRCASSTNALNATGTYTDYMSAWRSKKGKLRWLSLSGNSATQTTNYIECKADVANTNASNPGSPAQANGYPLSTDSGPYTAAVGSSNVSWDSFNPVTLFTANYMNWYHNSSLQANRTRIEIARDVVTDIIEANPNVDFGLMVFNQNNQTDESGTNGGYVATKINTNMTTAQRAALVTTVDGITAWTWTPLCETLYEAYRYFAGLGVVYGDDESSPTPARDMTAQSGSTYVSPMGSCQQAYVIFMTDGEPTHDTKANTAIDALPGIGTTTGSRLDELAGWLYANDLDGNSSNGIQRVVTYTIGFTTNQTLLKDTAKKGGGTYFTADNSAQLQNAFQGAINQIMESTATFTAPAVAVNSFNRSRSLDDIFIAMFKPSTQPRWTGNLKRLRIDSNGFLKDYNGVDAIDPTTGNLRDTAQTFWSTAVDGNEVEAGGVGGKLATRDPNSRVIKTNTGTGGALETFATTNTSLTAALFGAASDTEKDQLINWARGVDVDDEDEDDSTTDTRPWLLGDPLHSRPLVINYGLRGSYTTKENPDIRILMGTNHATFHMFSANTPSDADGVGGGAENWVFIPKELLPVIKTVRDNNSANEHPYAVDGSAVAYTYDKNNDGTISGADDKVYVFFGLRRGGNAYYALNLSDPDNPSFMWKIDSSTTGFSELGQSWATPLVTTIPGHTGPVLIISGGYDTAKDADGTGTSASIGTDDSEGRGVFIVDALTGALIWSATPAVNSATNLQVTALKDSIPASAAAIDSNGDNLMDRIYLADTGGQLWRIDMPGNTLPTATQTTWSMFKLADFGGTTASTDRRFFTQPDVISTRYNGESYDAIALGSGDREHPNETNVINRFYMIKDAEILTSYHGTSGTAIPSALSETNLYDATANLVQDGTGTQQTAAIASLSAAKGWYVTLEGTGEKSLAPSLTLGGTVFFTTFVPDTTSTTCNPIPGHGYLYGVSLHKAAAVYAEWEVTTTGTAKADRNVSIGDRLPDSVTPYFGDDGIRIIGVGAGENGSGSYSTGVSLRTMGIYWYRRETPSTN